MVVEDERIIARDILESLNRMGYEVPAVAATGDEAIAKAGAANPDLVLMDIMLEGDMDGIQAADQILRRYDIPVVFLTAYGDDSTLQRAKLSGPFGYTLKPFEDRELHTTIEVALHKHKLESRLKESERWLSTTLQSIGDAVIAIDADGKIKLINPVAEAITGWRRHQVEGKSLAETLMIVDEKTRFPIENPMIRAIREGEVVALKKNATLIAKDGTEKSIDDSAAPIKDDKGNITGGVMVFRDITKRRQAETALLQAQKLESLGVLVGGIAHDFNNLLVGILGNAGLALDHLPPLSPMRGRIKKIKAAALRAAEMVQQMISYVGASRSSSERIDLKLIIEEVVNLIQLSVSKLVNIRCDISSSLPDVEADPAQLRQVIMNLTVNASEAIGDGGGLITIGAGTMQAGRAYLDECFFGNGLQEGAYIFVEVSDTGKGMDASTRSRIFDPFFSTTFSGRGLGLAAVSGIVRNHHGAVHLNTAPGQGTAFRVLIPAPVNNVHPAASDERHAIAEPSLSQHVPQRTILVIDDDEAVRGVTAETLRQMDYRVLSAGGGHEGIAAFVHNAKAIDCVLLDLSMQQPGSESVFAEIRQIKNGVNVILMSGYNEEEALQQFSGIGLAGFLHKPYTNVELREILNRAFEERR
jgi:PAS domain S-box-containing protein